MAKGKDKRTTADMFGILSLSECPPSQTSRWDLRGGGLGQKCERLKVTQSSDKPVCFLTDKMKGLDHITPRCCPVCPQRSQRRVWEGGKSRGW